MLQVQSYPSETLIKEDVFYYVYGLLHSPDYRERYGDNPRYPLELLLRVITVSVETMKLVNELPKLD